MKLHKTRKSVEQINEANTALDSISASVNQIMDMNTQIAAATEQMSSTVNEIDRNMANISDAADNNAERSDRLSDTGCELSKHTQDLQEAIGSFQV